MQETTFYDYWGSGNNKADIYIEEKEIIAKIHAMTKTLVASILENEKPVYVDFETQERIPKDSALWYKEVIKTNGECLSINDDRRV
jgi:hypothetical protein